MSDVRYHLGPHETIEEDYDLGSFTIQPTDGVYVPMDVRLRGTITRPSANLGTALPLIILAHGRHTDTVENFRGLVYLARYLSSHGYACASIDLNDLVQPGATMVSKKPLVVVGGAIEHRAATILRTITALRAHPALGDIVNFGNVGLIGHSRGAEAVARAGAISQHSGSAYGVRAVFSIAPVDFTNVHLGLPFFLLYGDLDADVADGQPFRIWDRAMGPKHGIYVSGANHNFFSDNWEDEWKNVKRGPQARTLARADHEQIASIFTHAFFDTYLKQLNALPSPDQTSLGEDLAHVQLSQLYGSTDQLLIDAFEGQFRPEVNALGGATVLTGNGQMREYELEPYIASSTALQSGSADYAFWHGHLRNPEYSDADRLYIRAQLAPIAQEFRTALEYFSGATEAHTRKAFISLILGFASDFVDSIAGWEALEKRIGSIEISPKKLIEIAGYIEKHERALHAFNHAGKGLRIDWNAKDVAYSTEIGSRDFSAYAWISFRAGQCYRSGGIDSDLNPPNTNQFLTVLITDVHGVSSAVVLSGVDGRGIEYPKSDQYVFKSGLMTFVIPTADFAAAAPNLDLRAIARVGFAFDRAERGSVVIDSICLTN